jgi:hypothetical protein
MTLATSTRPLPQASGQVTVRDLGGARRSVGEVQTLAQLQRLAGVEHLHVHRHLGAAADQVHDLDRPRLEAAHQRDLAAIAHQLERRAQVDLAVGPVEHQAAPADHDLHAIVAGVVGEGAGHGDRRAAEAPDLAAGGRVGRDIGRHAAAVLPGDAPVLRRGQQGHHACATVPSASRAETSAGV